MTFVLGIEATFFREAARDFKELPSFQSFIEAYGRSFTAGSHEYGMRRELFDRRLQDVKHQNQRAQRLWTAVVNEFSDRTDVELQSLFGWQGFVGAKKLVEVTPQRPRRSGVFLGQSESLPEEKFWDHLNASKLDINQRHCGSCWAVSSALILQAGAEANGISRTFSTQELVSCVPNPKHCGGEGGCHGATVELAMQYVMQHGLKTEEEWPYAGSTVGQSTAKCTNLGLLQAPAWDSDELEEIVATGVHTINSETSPASRFRLAAWEKLPTNRYEPLMHALVKHGPVAVSVAAKTWHQYGEGILDNCDKDAVVNHAVTLLGYGRDAEAKYWKIKNSWGLRWGEEGTIRLLRKDDDEIEQCGVDRQPGAGVGCDGGPKEVRVCGMCGILFDSVVPHFS